MSDNLRPISCVLIRKIIGSSLEDLIKVQRNRLIVKAPSIRQFPFALIVFVNVLFAGYLVYVGLKGFHHAPGMPDIMVAVLHIAAGGITALSSAPALWWSINANSFSPREYTIRLIVALFVGGFFPVLLVGFL